MSKSFYWISLLALSLLLTSCLSLKIVLQLPQEAGAPGNLQMQYKFAKSLQDISNYPAPHNDIAPMPLPLWEWDFRSVASQSESIQLQDYSFQQAQELSQTAVIKVQLSFVTEQDLQLLLGKEIQWTGNRLDWHLSANDSESPDLSYPQLDSALSSGETQLLEQVFAGQSLEVIVQGPQKAEQRLSMADFVTGKQDLQISMK